MPFARMEAAAGTEAPKPLLGLDSSYWFKIIEAAILCITALLIGLFVAKPLINRMFAAQTAAAGALADRQCLAGRRRLARARRRDRARPPADGTPRAARALVSIDISRIDGQVRDNLRQESR